MILEKILERIIIYTAVEDFGTSEISYSLSM